MGIASRSSRPSPLRCPLASSRTVRRALAAAALLIVSCGASAGVPVRFPDATPRYHDGDLRRCADCHLFRGTEPLGTGAVGPALLRADDPLDLCLSCHDGRVSIPDVLGADANGLADRSAGFFGPPDVPATRGHALGHLGGRLRGAVTCIDCHDPHGNGMARNLRAGASSGIAPALGLFVDPTATGTSRYEAARVAFGTLDDDRLREVSAVCLRCHPECGGESCGPGRHRRHPSYDSRRGAGNAIDQGAARGSTDPAHWERGVGSGFETPRVRTLVRGATSFAGAQVVSARRNAVFCLSCHKAHGSAQPFALVWPAERGITAIGCDQCHDRVGEAAGDVAGRNGSAPARAGPPAAGE